MNLENYSWLARLLWLGLLAFLAALLYNLTFKSAWSALTLSRFVSQQCVMVSKTVREDNSGGSLANRGYIARVAYRSASEAGGPTYTKISPFWTTGSWKEQKALIDSLPEPGQPVRCYVDPENPDQAYLFTKIEWLGVLLSLIPVLFATVTFLGWRAYRRLEREEAGPVS